MSHVRTLLAKELTDSLRDRRTLKLMIGVPLLLYPGMLLLLGAITSVGRERLSQEKLVVALVGEDASSLAGAPPPLTVFQPMGLDAAKQALREQHVAAIIEAPVGAAKLLAKGEQAKVTLWFSQRYDKSAEGLERLRKSMHQRSVHVLEERLVAARLPGTFAEPVKAEEVDVDFQNDLGPLIASKLLPIILLAMLLMGATYPALDLTAGEKERGTLETLLCAPVRPHEVMAAKLITVTVIATAVTLLNLAAMVLTLKVGLNFGNGVGGSLTLGAGQLALLALCLVPSALMISGVVLAVASMAGNYKEGQSLMGPLSLFGTLPGMLALMPGVELNAFTAAVPLLNVALLVKALILGSARPLHVVITLASIALASLGSIALAARAFQSEVLRFGGAESWKEVFWRKT